MKELSINSSSTPTTTFTQVLEKLNTTKKSRDPREIRLSAVSSALIETILDRRLKSNKSTNYKEIVPFEIFACTITALEGTILSKDDVLEQQLPLLQILQLVLPFCHDNMFLSQFKLLARILRSLGNYYVNYTKLETNDELGGGNAMLRHVITTSREAILAYNKCNTNQDIEVVKKLYETCIISLLEDKRPKVRRCAQSSIMEFSSDTTNWMEEYFLSYCMTYIKSHSNKLKEEEMIKLTHLFNFLQSIFTTISNKNINDIIKISDEIMKLSMLVLNTYNNEEYKIIFINSSWNVILSVLDVDSGTQGEMVSFASRVLATLLQVPNGKPFSVSSSSLQNHCHVMYTKLIVSSFHILLSDEGQLEIVKKLLPTTFAIVVHSCDYVIEEEEEKRVILQGVTSECQRFLSALSNHTSLLINDVDKYIHALSIFLQMRFRTVYDIVLPCFATGLATVLSCNNASKLLKELVDMHAMVNDKNTQTCIENAVGLIIQRIGIESFLDYIPISINNSIPKERAWLLPLLKTHGSYTSSPPTLSFFQNSILPLARQCDAVTSSKTSPLEISIEKRKCMELWSLFSCFCNYPSDVCTTFPKLLNTIIKALGDVDRYPALVNIICSGVITLAHGATNNPQDLNCISSATTKLLPTLFKLVESLTNTDKMELGDTTPSSQEYQLQHLTKSISELAKIAPKPFLQSLFQKLLQRLLQQDETKLSPLLYLSQGLVSSQALNTDCISLLYKSIKPCILTNNIKIQKKGYKVMAELCQYYASFLMNEERKKDVLELLIGSIVTCHVSCRYWRLKCFYCLIEGLGTDVTDVIPQIMGEVILCLKDRNTKTRELGYQLILSMYYSIEDKVQYFQVVTAGLAGQTPAMRSASVMALSRLIFEVARGDDAIHALLPNLLSTVLVLLQNTSKKREEVKSCVSFIRVTVAAMSSSQLEPLLQDVISTLFQQQKKMKRFRSKIKIILQKLVKIYGYEKVTPLMPEKDVKLLEYLKKTQEKEARKKNLSDNVTTRTDANFDQMMDSEEERDDSDDDEDEDSITQMSRSTKHTAKSGKTRDTFTKDDKTFKSTMAKTKATTKSTSTSKTLLLRNETNDVHDFLHSNMYKNLQIMEEGEEDSDFDFSDDDGDVLEFDDDGRLIVPDDAKKEEDDDSSEEEKDEIKVKSNKQRRISKHQTVKEAKQKKAKELGAAYKSKKAKGDVKLKHQTYEPYAYVPLDSRNYSKKKRGATVKQMGSVVRSNKRKRG